MRMLVVLIFAAVFISMFLIGIGSTTTLAYAQVEEQEGNLEGKLEKVHDVIDACQRMVEEGKLTVQEGGSMPEAIERDCFPLLGAFNVAVSEMLSNNSKVIEDILYGR
jgi:hypothetical protein